MTKDKTAIRDTDSIERMRKLLGLEDEGDADDDEE